MIIQEKYIEEIEGKKYYAVGNGSTQLVETANERIGPKLFSKYKDNELLHCYNPLHGYTFYAIEEKYFHLFNAKSFVTEKIKLVDSKHEVNFKLYKYYVYDNQLKQMIPTVSIRAGNNIVFYEYKSENTKKFEYICEMSRRLCKNGNVEKLKRMLEHFNETNVSRLKKEDYDAFIVILKYEIYSQR